METDVQALREESQVLSSLLEVGVNLSTTDDRGKLLNTILREARKLVGCEAGSLYVREGGVLSLAAAQNDNPAAGAVGGLLARELPIGSQSVAGYVAQEGRVVNIPDAYDVAQSAPFRVNHDFDRATGYRAVSMLAMPLKCPDGRCVGVLELINRLGKNGRAVPFPQADSDGVTSLAAMASVTIHNALLRDELKQAHLDTIIRLSVAAEFREDPAASDHVRRMSHASGLIAAAMGLTAKHVDLVRFATPMHDIGKIGIPDAILNKPGRLTPEERKVIERHTVIGGEILNDPRSELMIAAHDVALTHHEKWDGSGYPQGLGGSRIPLNGRVAGLADVFDALVSARCYKEPTPVEQVLGTIRDERGKHFDPKVVDAFFAALDDVLEVYDVLSSR